MNLNNLYKLDQAIEKRYRYLKEGDQNNNIQFDKLEILDKKILKLIKITYK